MRSSYPLFNSHIDLAHNFWLQHLKVNDVVVDATCGNGHDTLFLAQQNKSKIIHSIDIQEIALIKTQQLIDEKKTSMLLSEIQFHLGCHSMFPKEIAVNSVNLIVYNLGYLPGSNKSLTTQTETTLKSLQAATELIIEGGVISIMCYPGHSEGAAEEAAILAWSKKLTPSQWCAAHMQLSNRLQAPSLMLLQKAYRKM